MLVMSLVALCLTISMSASASDECPHPRYAWEKLECNDDFCKWICEKCGYITDECPHPSYAEEELDYGEETCTVDGFYKWLCEECGYVGYKVYPALGHNYKDEWTEILPATCYDRGVLTNRCSRCHENIYKAIDIIEHTDADADGICDVCSFAISAKDSPADTTTPEVPDISDNQEEVKGETNIFSFLTELLNNLFSFLRDLFKIG